MRRSRVLLGMALAALLFAGACSSGSEPRAAQSSVNPTAAASARGSKSAPARSSKQADTKTASNKPRADTERDDVKQASNENEEYTSVPSFDIAVRAIPTCALHGEKVRIEIVTEPKAHLVINVFYADFRSHDSFHSGDADSKGNYLYALQVPLDAPPGDVSVDVIGERYTDQGGEIGSAGTSFTVAIPGGCG